jgi:hypothetical protein
VGGERAGEDHRLEADQGGVLAEFGQVAADEAGHRGEALQ